LLGSGLAFDSWRLKLVALLPPDHVWQARGFPSQGEAEASHSGIAGEVHVGMIFITGLMIVLRGIVAVLLQSPHLVMPLELHALID